MSQNPSHQTISAANAPPQVVVYGPPAPTPYYGPPRSAMMGYRTCEACGGGMVDELPICWIVTTVIFTVFCFGLGLICLICVFSERKLRCLSCGNTQPYPGGGC